MRNEIYPRTGDKEIVYLKDVVNRPNIEIGDYTIHNDFVRDPHHFEWGLDIRSAWDNKGNTDALERAE